MDERSENYRNWQQQLRAALAHFGDIAETSILARVCSSYLSFSVRDIKGEVLINALQKHGVIVSATSSACSSRQTKTSHVVEALNIDEHFKTGVVRVSFGAHVTSDYITQLIQVINTVLKEV
ncbi:Aminotransferase class V OS=Lysinibacillus sphaericus OX=1421 GN=LS41612_06300 PE=4 SV=1 [Lysinibacillus sphaericus]